MSIGILSDRTIAGEMYIKHPDPTPYTVDITVADTYARLTGGQDAGFIKKLGQDVIVDPLLGTFTIKRYGNYKFDGFASLKPNAGMAIHFAVFVTNSFQEHIESGIEFKNSQDTQTFSGTGWLENLNPGDVVSVHGQSDTVPVTVWINHMNISLERRGRS